MRRKQHKTQSGRLSKTPQPSKARYQAILNERNARANELGADLHHYGKRGSFEYIKEYIHTNTVIDPITGCWIWLKSLQNVGYGLIEVPRTEDDGPGPITDGVEKKTKTRTVHKVAYEEFRGPIPKGLNVAHHCDVTYCCNPEHLWLATPKENMEDKVRKGRMKARGLYGSSWNSGIRKFTDGVRTEFFKPGTEPNGWWRTYPDYVNNYVPKNGVYKMSLQGRENIKKGMAARKQAQAIIKQLQANNSPQMV